jgi:hypothetical protein
LYSTYFTDILVIHWEVHLYKSCGAPEENNSHTIVPNTSTAIEMKNTLCQPTFECASSPRMKPVKVGLTIPGIVPAALFSSKLNFNESSNLN